MAVLGAAGALACSTAALAAKQNSSVPVGGVYRCKDSSGQTYYGDSMPKACQGLDTEVIGDNGMVLRTIEGTQSRLARERREAREAKERQIREERQKHDRMLIETYVSVEDIERLRDQRLELLESQYRITEQNISNLHERQSRIKSQIARFKPYNQKPGAPALPDHLAEELVNMVNGMRVYEETLAANRAEQAEIKDTFDADIQRFKELKGIE